MAPKRNYTIDLFKFIAALLIIGIHTEPFSEVNGNLCFFVVELVCRLAVPFFAICSGYFISQSIIKNDRKFTPVKRQEIKLIKLYAVWTILYFLFDIPFAVSGGYFTIKNHIGFAISTVTIGSHYHLWYLISLIYALPLLYLCVRFVRRNALVPIMAGLYFIKVLSYGYTKWLPIQVNSVFNLFHKFDALFDAVFLLLPLMLLGYIISTGKIPELKWCVLGFCFSFALLTVEAFTLRSFGQESVSFIFFTFPTAYFAFSLISHLKFGEKLKYGKMLGSVSLIIYCFHPMIVEILPKDMYSILKYLIVAIVSIAFSVGYYYIKLAIVKIRTRNV